MKTLLIIATSLSITLVCSCVTSKRQGRYIGAGYVSGYQYILKNDSTFEFKFRGHMISDTSVGRYSINQDTVYFDYQLNDSSILASLAPARPESAIWKKSKLYLMFNETEKRNRKGSLKFMK